MSGFLKMVESVNGKVNGFVWGIPMLVLLVGTGVLMTCLTGWFQVSHFRYWLRHTIGAIFKNKHVTAHTDKEDRSISQFQSLCTALAATIGTGNIAGVASAIASGGPGAIFWMWLGKILAFAFSVFCVIASFGIGNMGQINSIATNMYSAFRIPNWVTGILLMGVAALVVVGGLKRIAAVTEKLVPVMALVYVVGALVLVILNVQNVGPAFASIFKGAFAMKAVGGGIVGSGVKAAVTWGMKRGVFSNEAGLGSSVMVHSNSNVKEPVVQGMWGIFEVFADTLVVCTLTALAVLTSGLVDLNTGALLTTTEKTAMVAEAFSLKFGAFGSGFIAIAILLFAFSTVLGWSHYGTKAFEYLFGTKATIGYRIVFVAFILVGATMQLDLAWDLSDTFNGLMAIPNLVGVVALSGQVRKITKNYIARKMKGENLEPIYTAFPELQKEEENA